MTSTQYARQEAAMASSRYGWTRERSSDTLEPQLVRSFVHGSGNDPSSLPPPPVIRRAEPLYQEAGIDWDRWGQISRTDHRSYPSPAVPPNRPLPTRPLCQKHKIAERYMYEDPKPLSIPRKPIPISKESSRRGREASSRYPVHQESVEVSPPSSPIRSWSPISPVGSPAYDRPRRARSVISNLNHQIDEVLDHWEAPREMEREPRRRERRQYR